MRGRTRKGVSYKSKKEAQEKLLRYPGKTFHLFWMKKAIRVENPGKKEGLVGGGKKVRGTRICHPCGDTRTSTNNLSLEGRASIRINSRTHWGGGERGLGTDKTKTPGFGVEESGDEEGAPKRRKSLVLKKSDEPNNVGKTG